MFAASHSLPQSHAMRVSGVPQSYPPQSQQPPQPSQPSSAPPQLPNSNQSQSQQTGNNHGMNGSPSLGHPQNPNQNPGMNLHMGMSSPFSGGGGTATPPPSHPSQAQQGLPGGGFGINPELATFITKFGTNGNGSGGNQSQGQGGGGALSGLVGSRAYYVSPQQQQQQQGQGQPGQIGMGGRMSPNKMLNGSPGQGVGGVGGFLGGGGAPQQQGQGPPKAVNGIIIGGGGNSNGPPRPQQQQQQQQPPQRGVMGGTGMNLMNNVAGGGGKGMPGGNSAVFSNYAITTSGLELGGLGDRAMNLVPSVAVLPEHLRNGPGGGPQHQQQQGQGKQPTQQQLSLMASAVPGQTVTLTSSTLTNNNNYHQSPHLDASNFQRILTCFIYEHLFKSKNYISCDSVRRDIERNGDKWWDESDERGWVEVMLGVGGTGEIIRGGGSSGGEERGGGTTTTTPPTSVGDSPGMKGKDAKGKEKEKDGKKESPLMGMVGDGGKGGEGKVLKIPKPLNLGSLVEWFPDRGTEMGGSFIEDWLFLFLSIGKFVNSSSNNSPSNSLLGGEGTEGMRKWMEMCKAASEYKDWESSKMRLDSYTRSHGQVLNGRVFIPPKGSAPIASFLPTDNQRGPVGGVGGPGGPGGPSGAMTVQQRSEEVLRKRNESMKGTIGVFANQEEVKQALLEEDERKARESAEWRARSGGEFHPGHPNQQPPPQQHQHQGPPPQMGQPPQMGGHPQGQGQPGQMMGQPPQQQGHQQQPQQLPPPPPPPSQQQQGPQQPPPQQQQPPLPTAHHQQQGPPQGIPMGIGGLGISQQQQSQGPPHGGPPPPPQMHNPNNQPPQPNNQLPQGNLNQPPPQQQHPHMMGGGGNPGFVGRMGMGGPQGPPLQQPPPPQGLHGHGSGEYHMMMAGQRPINNNPMPSIQGPQHFVYPPPQQGQPHQMGPPQAQHPPLGQQRMPHIPPQHQQIPPPSVPPSQGPRPPMMAHGEPQHPFSSFPPHRSQQPIHHVAPQGHHPQNGGPMGGPPPQYMLQQQQNNMGGMQGGVIQGQKRFREDDPAAPMSPIKKPKTDLPPTQDDKKRKGPGSPSPSTMMNTTGSPGNFTMANNANNTARVGEMLPPSQPPNMNRNSQNPSNQESPNLAAASTPQSKSSLPGPVPPSTTAPKGGKPPVKKKGLTKREESDTLSNLPTSGNNPVTPREESPSVTAPSTSSGTTFPTSTAMAPSATTGVSSNAIIAPAAIGSLSLTDLSSTPTPINIMSGTNLDNPGPMPSPPPASSFNHDTDFTKLLGDQDWSFGSGGFNDSNFEFGSNLEAMDLSAIWGYSEPASGGEMPTSDWGLSGTM